MNNPNDRNPTHTLSAAEESEFASLLNDLRDSAHATASYHRERAIIAPASSRVPRMAWALASLALTISIATPFALHKNHVTAQVAAPAIVAPATTTPPAISDDALLADVQDDLTASVPTAMLPLTTTTSTSTQLTTTTQRNSQ